MIPKKSTHFSQSVWEPGYTSQRQFPNGYQTDFNGKTTLYDVQGPAYGNSTTFQDGYRSGYDNRPEAYDVYDQIYSNEPLNEESYTPTSKSRETLPLEYQAVIPSRPQKFDFWARFSGLFMSNDQFAMVVIIICLVGGLVLIGENLDLNWLKD